MSRRRARWQGTTDTVQVTAITQSAFAQQSVLSANQTVQVLSPTQVTTPGNQNAFSSQLAQVALAIQQGDTKRAADLLKNLISRTDGCERTGAPDGNGPGRDWITDCAAQSQMLAYLRAALAALPQ